MPVAGRVRAVCGSGAGVLAAKSCAVKVRAAGIAPQRRLRLAVPHDQRARGQVAQPLVLAGDEHGDHSDRVEEGKLVHVADQVAGHGLEEADGAAGALDDANPGHALARRAAVPEGLKEREVAPVEQEDDENNDGHGPLRRDSDEGVQRQARS